MSTPPVQGSPIVQVMGVSDQQVASDTRVTLITAQSFNPNTPIAAKDTVQQAPVKKQSVENASDAERELILAIMQQTRRLKFVPDSIKADKGFVLAALNKQV